MFCQDCLRVGPRQPHCLCVNLIRPVIWDVSPYTNSPYSGLNIMGVTIPIEDC